MDSYDVFLPLLRQPDMELANIPALEYLGSGADGVRSLLPL